MVVFAVDISRRMMELSQDEPSMWMTHSAATAMQPHQRNGSAHVPRDASSAQS